MLVQEVDDIKEYPIYYLSKKLLDSETRYTVVEKTCTTMVWLTKKLRHYFQSYRIQAMAKVHLIKHLCQTPSLVGKLSRYLLLLLEIDIEYLTKKVIKGCMMAEFLANQSLESELSKNLEFPNEQLAAITHKSQKWPMYFAGAANKRGAELGVIILTSEKEIIPLSKRLEFPTTNNGAEYKACLFQMSTLLTLKENEVEIIGDLELVVKQVTRDWELNEESLIPFLEAVWGKITMFNTCEFLHVQ